MTDAVRSSCDERPRRGFLVKFGAGIIGGWLAGVSAFVGFVRWFNPRQADRPRDGIRIAALDSLPDDGEPRAFLVNPYHWLASLRNEFQPIGGVYLIREPGEATVRAFNFACTHDGCEVGYAKTDNCFKCPCHGSAFDLHGRILSERSKVPPRDMDALDCEVRVVGSSPEIWVKFANFKYGTKEKIIKT